MAARNHSLETTILTNAPSQFSSTLEDEDIEKRAAACYAKNSA